MRPMAKTPGGFRAALLIGWVALGAAGVLYARWKGIPSWAALPVTGRLPRGIPILSGTGLSARAGTIGGHAAAGFLSPPPSCPISPCCTGAVQFQLVSFVKLIALALALGLWYRVLPAVPVVDVGFLVLIVAVKLGRYCDRDLPYALQRSRDRHPRGPRPFQYFGAGADAGPPRRRDRIRLPAHRKRVAHRAPQLPLLPAARRRTGVPAARRTPRRPVGSIETGRATFIGFLFGLALSEEFFFRGVLQQWLEEWTWSRRTALILTSILFGWCTCGSAHFPNWRWVIIAGALGWFCGRARNQAGSIRAGMVTHALVVATWRAFFAVTRENSVRLFHAQNFVQSNLYGKTRISRTWAHGLPHGPQPAARRTRSGALVPHRRQGPKLAAEEKGKFCDDTAGRWRKMPTASSCASAIPPWRRT